MFRVTFFLLLALVALFVSFVPLVPSDQPNAAESFESVERQIGLDVAKRLSVDGLGASR